MNSWDRCVDWNVSENEDGNGGLLLRVRECFWKCTNYLK